jgi:hypothetical protein
MMKRAVVIIIVLICLIFVRWWHHTIYHDQNVIVGKTISLFSLINIHGTPRQYIKVHAHTYQDVRGLPPCYLKVPELNSVLFVTQRPDRDIVFHVINLKTDEEIRIDGKYATFGWAIGSGRKNGESYTDYIEHADSNYVIAVSSYPDAKKAYYLNLVAQKLDKIVYEELQSGGKIKKKSVYVNGVLMDH